MGMLTRGGMRGIKGWVFGGGGGGGSVKRGGHSSRACPVQTAGRSFTPLPKRVDCNQAAIGRPITACLAPRRPLVLLRPFNALGPTN